MIEQLALPNYKSRYEPVSSESFVYESSKKITPTIKQVQISDSNKDVAKTSAILLLINEFTAGLSFSISSLAFENALKLFKTAYQAKLSPRVFEHLENDEGLFMDFTLGDSYYAFELYNDGGIISIRKIGDQNSIIEEIQSVEDITF